MGLWCALVAPFFFGGLAAIAGLLALQIPAPLRLFPFLIVPLAFGALVGARRGSWPVVLCLLGSIWWGFIWLAATSIPLDPVDSQGHWVIYLVPLPASALFFLGVFLRRRRAKSHAQRA